MNRNELRAHMARHGDTNETMAKALNMSVVSFSVKINGRQDFTQSEIQGIIDRYKLEAPEVITIFFTPEVSLKTDTLTDSDTGNGGAH